MAPRCRTYTAPVTDKPTTPVSMSKDGMAISRFSFEMADPKHLGHLLRTVRNVEGVYDVYRVTSA